MDTGTDIGTDIGMDITEVTTRIKPPITLPAQEDAAIAAALEIIAPPIQAAPEVETTLLPMCAIPQELPAQAVLQ
jgi:hypothetical protein